MSVKRFLKSVKDLEKQSYRRQEAPKETHSSGSHDESNWLVSYADMMTLLCGFFIMLFSMAKIDEPKYEALKESVSKQFGGGYKSPNEELARMVNQMVQELGITQDTVVKADPSGVSIAFQSTIFFDTLSSEVKPDGKNILNRLIDGIASRQGVALKSYRIVVEGHTDSRPVLSGTFPTNWELSGSRAARVVRMFLDKGFQPDHLTAIGYADTYPEAPSRTPAGTYDEAALAKNRRVVVRILEPGVTAIPFPNSEQVAAAATLTPQGAIIPPPSPPAPVPAAVVAKPAVPVQAAPAQPVNPTQGAPARPAAPVQPPAAGQAVPAQPAPQQQAPVGGAPVRR